MDGGIRPPIRNKWGRAENREMFDGGDGLAIIFDVETCTRAHSRSRVKSWRVNNVIEASWQCG